MKKIRKALSILLVVLILLTSAPLSGFVGFELNLPNFKAKAANVSGGYLMSGYCGDTSTGKAEDISWELSNSGVLTVIGTGKIVAEAFNYDLRIKEVIISDGITNISEKCFNQCSNLIKITLGKDITTIADSAFNSCSKLVNINLPESVTSIGSFAFQSCSYLTTVSLSESLTSVGTYAFNCCYNLKNITLPGSLKKLGDSVFRSCESLTDVEIPDSVTTLGAYCFSSCKNLKTVTIGSGITSISTNTFDSCSSLACVNVSEENKYYSSVDGIIYNKAKTKMHIVPEAVSGEITIPATVTSFTYSAVNYCDKITAIHVEEGSNYYKSVDGIVYTISNQTLVFCPRTRQGIISVAENTKQIGNFAFNNCYYITEVIVPNSLTSVGEFAFQSCSDLKTINMNEGLTSIGKCAFNLCSSLENVTLPGTLKKIAESAFDYCETFTNIQIPDSVTTFGTSVFTGCENLETVTIGSGVTSISDNTFGSCSSLARISISEENQYFSSVDGIVYNKAKTKIHVVPEAIDGEITIPATVTSFDILPVNNCDKITAINVESGNNYYKSIDGIVYTADGKTLCVCPRGMNRVPVIVAEGTETIRKMAFQSCDSIVRIVLPESLKTIEGFALSSCSSLSDIILPDSLETIGEYAFQSCSALKNINIPPKIVSICNNMFRYCGFIDFVFPETVQSFDDTTNWRDLKTFTITNRYCKYASDYAPGFPTNCTIRAYCGSPAHELAVKRLINFESIGHTYLDWYVVQPATFEANGIERRDCAYCDGYDERTIPQLKSKIFTATFVADGKIVATVDFPQGATEIAEPKVPTKDRYIGEWENYSLADANITINAVYTLIMSADTSEIATESKAIHYTDKDDVLFKLKACADATVVKSTSFKPIPLDIVLVVDQSDSMDETLGGSVKKVDALKDAVKDFVNTILENTEITGADHRVSIIGFGDSGIYEGYENTELLTSINGIVEFDDIKTTDYASSLLSVNKGGKINSDLITAIDSISASGGAAADLGFEMAKGIFANTDSDGIQRVVVFITDGKPTYTGEFQTSVANAAIVNAHTLKNTYKASIYSVGVFSDGDSQDSNVNKFMNAVTSGYPDAMSMSFLGEGVDDQYYLTVNNTDSLVSVYRSISAESLLHTVPFEKLTFIKNLSENVTLTTKQEEQLRIDIIRKYGISNDDIIISRNGDGTTTIQINLLTPYKVVDDEGNVTYEVAIEFFASLNEKTSAAGVYGVDTEDSGVMLGSDAGGFEATFDTSTITLVNNKTRVVFTINGEVYEISEKLSNGYAVAPEVEFSNDWVFSGWDTTSKRATNGMVLDATLTKADRTITWHTADSDIVQHYAAGAIITAPIVGTNSVGDIFLSWDKSVPTTMPDENLEFTAIYGAHIHSYTSHITKEMSCISDGVRTFTCSCGDAYDETITAIGHNYEAITAPVEKSEAICTICCTNCGDKYDYALDYYVVEVSGTRHTLLYEFRLIDDELNSEIQLDDEIQIRIPLSELYNSAEAVTVVSVNNDGTKTNVHAIIENGFLLIGCDNLLPKEVVFYIPCKEHVQGEWTVTKEASCTQKGSKERTCTVCGYVETAETELKAHTSGEVVIENEVSPTCTLDGSHDEATYCTVCGAETSRNTVVDKATSHNPSTPATCTTAQTCITCGEELAAKLGHTEVSISAMSATCTSTGLTEGKKCSTCGEITVPQIQTSPDKNNHVGETYIKDDKTATCLEDGYTGDTYCSDCDALLEKGEVIPATDHDWGEWETVTPTKCEVDGLEKRVCKNDSNHVEENVLPAINHKWDEGIIDPVSTCKTHGVKTYTCQNDASHKKSEQVALDESNHVGETFIKDDKTATCEEDGYTGDTYCSDCDKLLEKGTVIPATDHDWEAWTTVTPATCEVDGVEKRICRNDSSHVEMNLIPAINHDWDEGVIDTTSTCNTHGTKTYTCQNDASHTYTEEVPLDENNHIGETYVKDDKTATCLEDGYTGDTYCSDCDALLEKGEVIPATDHDWDAWYTETPATCEEDGLEKRICKNDASHVETNVLPAINHDWDEGVIDPVSTCKTHGVKTYTCQNDASHKKSEQVALDESNHVGETYIKDDKTATCEEDGYTGDTYCSDCDALLEKGEAIPATDHDWGEWTTVTPATCEVDGLEKRVCKNDSNHVEENVLPAIKHKWDDGVIDPVSTCKTHGVKTYTCQNDTSHKKSEQVALDESNHVGETYIKDDKTATCLEDGYTGDTYCSDCDALLEKGEVIPATDHDWDAWYTETPATCEEDGLEKRICKNDASHVETNVLPAINHDWDEGVIDPESTCNFHGTKTYTCQNDASHTYTEEVPLDENNHIGETYVKDDKAATCLEDGYTGDTYCSDCDALLEKGEAIPATDHDWGEWETVTPAKCEVDGLEKRVCKNDSSHIEENILPAIEHDYHKIADKCKAPDYGVAGYDYYECSYDASHNYTVEVAPLVKTTFTAKFITTAPFFKEDKVVAEVTFVQGDKFVEEPAVDKYDNYTFAWDDYELKDEDIVIYGRYTEIEINDITTPEAEKKAEINNGVATITLEAKANSKNIKILSEKTKPVDVVLVLDQSGSMAETLSSNGKTKRDALVECANDFVKELYDNAVATGAEHRVAVVGFSYSDYNGGNYKNTGILATSNGKSINYKSLKNADYASALMSVVATDGINTNITKGINSVVADGATSAHLGLEMANNIFAMTNKESGRERIVLFITDGTPTSWGEETDLVKTTAAKAITEANELKNAQGAKVYSIGVHANANPTAGFTSDDYGVATDSRGSFKSYDFNRFLHAVSSNYPTAGSIRVSEMGEGSKNSGYYLGVQDTSKLSEIFSKILLSSVYEVKTFDKVTIVDTVSKEFTLTLEQETEMRERLMSELGIRNEDITVTRNEDGTTTLRFDNVRTQKVYNDDGSSYYSAKLSFDVSADKDSLGLTEVNTNTEDAGVEYDGETLNKFDVPTVVLEPDRKLIVFTVNGTVYRIEEAKLGDNIVAPESSLAQWNIAEGTVVEGDYVVFEASTVESKEYTVTWVSENSKITETYSFGELINIPDAVEKTDYDFLKWSPEVPATMPNYNITFTAAYTPKHIHTYNKAYTYGKCTEGITTVYKCACGDSYEEKADITEHSAKAVVEKTNSGTLIEKVTCQVCGVTNSQELTYKVTYREGWRNTVLDLTLLENDVSVQPDGTLEIRFYVGENINKNYTVYRIDENGNRTSYTPRKENGYLIFDADHFSFYVVAELDEETGEVADDTSYEEVYCVSNGHSYEGVVTEPTCSEKGYTTYTCSVCEDSYVADEVSALGHTEVTVKGYDATCTETGLTDGVKCSVCDEILTAQEVIPASGHKEETVNGKAATCIETGLTDGVKCRTCGITLTAQKIIDKLAHKDDNCDYKCDYGCGHEFEKPVTPDEPDTPDEPIDGNCDHLCHKSGFLGFIWKIVRFFIKLFGTNKVCGCGVNHY